MISNENRIRVVETAIRLFNANGCKSVTMDQIATELHMSKRTLYETFDSKEALLMECLIAVHREMGQEMMDVYKETQEPLLLTLYLIRNATNHNMKYARLLADTEKFHPELSQQMLNGFIDKFCDAMVNILQKAEADGDLRSSVDVREAAELIAQHVKNGSCTVNPDMNEFAKRLRETSYTYLRGLLSIQAIERYDRNEERFKTMLSK